MSAAARIAEVLAGSKVKARNGNYLVACPAHDDDSPSLSLKDTDRGIAVHCFAGCRAGDIYAAIRRKDRKLLEPGDTAPQPVKGSGDMSVSSARKPGGCGRCDGRSQARLSNDTCVKSAASPAHCQRRSDSCRRVGPSTIILR